MSEISTWLRGFSLIDWMIGGGLTFFAASFFRKMAAFLQSFGPTYKILKHNRPAYGRGYASHAADAFLEIWHRGQVPATDCRIIWGPSYTSPNYSKSQRQMLHWHEEHLERLGLTRRDGQHIKPIESAKNRWIAFWARHFCILWYGDAPKCYHDMTRGQR